MSYKETDIQDWQKEEILEWIRSIGLSETWTDRISAKVNELECTGNDLLEFKNGKELDERLEIENPMLSNRIYRELKKLKPNASRSNTMENNDNNSFQLDIYAQSQTWTFQNATSNTLIYDIKQWYKQQSDDNTPISDIIFFSNNETLNDNQTLSYYSINDNSNLITVEFNTQKNNWNEYAAMLTNACGFSNVPASSTEADEPYNQMFDIVNTHTNSTPSKITNRQQLIEILQEDGFYTNQGVWFDSHCPPASYSNPSYQQNEINEYQPVPPPYSSQHDNINGNGQIEANVQTNINQQDLFSNFFLRTIYMAASICLASILSFRMWFSESPNDSFNIGYGLSAFGAVVLCLGSVLTLICTLIRRIPAWTKWTMIIMYVTGGLFYFFGACGIANGWNSLGLNGSTGSAIAGIFFAEQSFLAFHGILAGFDLYKMDILNDKKLRVALYNMMFLGLALIDFFSYAVLSSTFSSNGIDNGIIAYLATFYFLVMIPSGLILVIYLKQRGQENSVSVNVLHILMGMFSLCVICILIGYFVLDVKYYGVFLGDRIGIFVLLTGIIIALDMSFDRFIPPCNNVNRIEQEYQSVTEEQSLKEPLL